MHTTLIGGGWDPAALAPTYGPFLAAASVAAGGAPTIACVVLDDGDGQTQAARWTSVLPQVAECRPVPVLVRLGGALETASLEQADAVLICGGLTPAYADALAPPGTLAGFLRETGRPYAGFSAGAAVAAERAVVGGWRDGGVQVCPEDSGEDLDEVTVVAGLGLLPAIVDVHCSAWGTLPRLLAAVRREGREGWGLDEGTAVHVADGRARVSGLGRLHRCLPTPDGAVRVECLSDGEELALAP